MAKPFSLKMYFSFYKELLSLNFESSTVLVTGKTETNQTEKLSAVMKFTLYQKTRDKLVNKYINNSFN